MAVNLDENDALMNVRDYTGSAPDDGTLYGIAETVGYWQEVALRVLRQRRADVNTGENLSSLNLGGDISLGFKGANFAALDAAIKDLENQIAELNGESVGTAVGVITRPYRSR